MKRCGSLTASMLLLTLLFPLRVYAVSKAPLVTLQTTLPDNVAKLLSVRLNRFVDDFPGRLFRRTGLRIKLPARIPFKLFATRLEFRKYAQRHAPRFVDTDGYCRGRMVVSYFLGNSILTLYHELVHSLMASSPLARAPIWLQEGLADFFAMPDTAPLRRDRLSFLLNSQRHHDRTLRPLHRFRARDFQGSKRQLVYAEAYLATAFLLKNKPLVWWKALAKKPARPATPSRAALVRWLTTNSSQPTGSMKLFDQQGFAGWLNELGGPWVVRGGVLHGRPTPAVLVRSTLPRASFRLSADLTLNGTLRILLGNNFHRDPPFYFRIELSARQLALYKSSSRRLLATTRVGLAPNKRHRLLIEIRGQELRIELNGRTRLKHRKLYNHFSVFGLQLHRGRVQIHSLVLSPPPTKK